MKRLNKTLLALFVCVSIVLTALAVPAFAAGTSLKAGVANIVVADGTITASAVFSNISGSAAATGKLILAQYVGGVLKSAAAADVTVAAKTENSAQVTADEVSDATVKCFLVEANNITPLAVTATKGANSPALSDILINGKSIGEVDSNQAFSADKNSYSIELSDDLVMPVVKGVVAEADNTYYAVTSYSYGSDYQTATAAVTVKSTTGAASYTYTVNFSIARETVNPHVIKGAASDADFEAVSDTTFGVELRSKNKVATTTIYSGSNDTYIGHLNTNLHTYTGSQSTEITPGKTASKIYANMPFRGWIVYKVNSEVLKGADYFAFRTNDSSAKFADVLYDGTNTISTLADGTALISFKLAADANVHIITTKPVPEYVSIDEYTESENKSGHIFGANPGNNKWDDRNFNYMYTKKFSAGATVTIPYRAGIAVSRTPLIAVTPVVEKTITPLITDYKAIVKNYTYEQYCKYANEDSSLKDTAGNTKIASPAKNMAGPCVLTETATIDRYGQRNFEYIVNGTGFENCYYIGYDNEQQKGWPRAAYYGEGNSTYCFENVVPWYSFKVNRDCDVIITANGQIAEYTYEKDAFGNEIKYTYEQKTPSFEYYRYKNDIANSNRGLNRDGIVFQHYYTKSFTAGQTVNLYNTPKSGQKYPIVIVKFK